MTPQPAPRAAVFASLALSLSLASTPARAQAVAPAPAAPAVAPAPTAPAPAPAASSPGSVPAPLAAAAPAPAVPPLPPPPRHPALRYDLRIDLPITIGTLLFGAVTEATKSYIVTPTCRWCDRDPMGRDTLNGLDMGARALRWDNIRTAAAISDGLLYGGAPFFALGGLALASGIEGGIRNFPVDLLVVAESVGVTMALTQIVKFSAMRERPFVHYPRLPGEPTHSTSADDNNLSFFSGHSSLTFSLAVSAGTVATLRRYRLAPMIWALGLTTAATTAYLRIGAEKHYMTDVLLGTVIGAGFGFAIPYLFHRPLLTSNVASRQQRPLAGLFTVTSVGYMALPEGGGGLVVNGLL